MNFKYYKDNLKEKTPNFARSVMEKKAFHKPPGALVSTVGGNAKKNSLKYKLLILFLKIIELYCCTLAQLY